MEVSDAYLKDIERYPRRFLYMQSLFLELLKDVTPFLTDDQLQYYEERRRGIDNHARTMENGNQG